MKNLVHYECFGQVSYQPALPKKASKVIAGFLSLIKNCDESWSIIISRRDKKPIQRHDLTEKDLENLPPHFFESMLNGVFAIKLSNSDVLTYNGKPVCHNPELRDMAKEFQKLQKTFESYGSNVHDLFAATPQLSRPKTRSQSGSNYLEDKDENIKKFKNVTNSVNRNHRYDTNGFQNQNLTTPQKMNGFGTSTGLNNKPVISPLSVKRSHDNMISTNKRVSLFSKRKFPRWDHSGETKKFFTHKTDEKLKLQHDSDEENFVSLTSNNDSLTSKSPMSTKTTSLSPKIANEISNNVTLTSKSPISTKNTTLAPRIANGISNDVTLTSKSPVSTKTASLVPKIANEMPNNVTLTSKSPISTKNTTLAPRIANGISNDVTLTSKSPVSTKTASLVPKITDGISNNVTLTSKSPVSTKTASLAPKIVNEMSNNDSLTSKSPISTKATSLVPKIANEISKNVTLTSKSSILTKTTSLSPKIASDVSNNATLTSKNAISTSNIVNFSTKNDNLSSKEDNLTSNNVSTINRTDAPRLEKESLNGGQAIPSQGFLSTPKPSFYRRNDEKLRFCSFPSSSFDGFKKHESVLTFDASSKRSKSMSQVANKENELLKKSVPYGFPNPGNLCYMNAVLQALFEVIANCQSCEILFLSTYRKIMNSGDEPNLFQHFCNLLELIRNDSEDIAQDIHRKLGNFKSCFETIYPSFKGNEMQDAHEFLTNLLSRMRTETALKRYPSLSESSTENKSLIDVYFKYCLLEVKTCTQCSNEVSTEQILYDCGINIPKNNKNLQSALSLAFKSGTQEFMCEKCHNKESICSTKVLELPRILVLYVKRYNWNNTDRCKDETKLIAPKFITLDPYADEEAKLSDFTDEMKISHEDLFRDFSVSGKGNWRQPDSLNNSSSAIKTSEKERSNENVPENDVLAICEDDEDLIRAKEASLQEYNQRLLEESHSEVLEDDQISPEMRNNFLTGNQRHSYRLASFIHHSGAMDGGHYTSFGFDYRRKKYYRFNDSTVIEVNEQNFFSSASTAYIFIYVHKDICLDSLAVSGSRNSQHSNAISKIAFTA